MHRNKTIRIITIFGLTALLLFTGCGKVRQSTGRNDSPPVQIEQPLPDQLENKTLRDICYEPLEESQKKYFIGESLSTANIVIVAEYEDEKGVISTADITAQCDVYVDGDMNTAGKYIVKAKYGETEIELFEITVEEISIDSISIKTMPNKTEYLYGETLDTAGLVVVVSRNNGTSEDITTGFSCVPMVLNTVSANYRIAVTYEGNAAYFSVKVDDYLDTIMAGLKDPARKFFAGDTITTADVSVTGNNKSGTKYSITNNYTVSPAKLSSGINTITVVCASKTTTFNITTGEITLQGISVNYTGGMVFPTNNLNVLRPGLSVTLNYNNGDKVSTTTYGLSAPNNKLSTPNTDVTVTISGSVVTAVFNVLVSEVELNSLTLNITTAKLYVGDNSYKAILNITGNYSDGSKQTIATNNVAYSPTTLNISGNNTIKVSIGNISANVIVIANAVTIDAIAVTSWPSQNYYAGNILNLTNLKVSASYNNGSVSTDFRSYTTTPNNGAILTTNIKVVTINVTGKPSVITTFSITVQPATLNSIAIATYNTTYNAGDYSWKAIRNITGNYTDGNRLIPTDNSNVSYQPVTLSAGNNQRITVNAYGKTATARINVSAASVTGISISAQPSSKNYILGETISTKDMVVSVNYSNGTSQTTMNYTIAPVTANTVTNNLAIVVTLKNSTITTSFTVSVNVANSSGSGTLQADVSKNSSIAGSAFVGNDKYAAGTMRAGDISSGLITTLKKVEVKHGRIDINAKIPSLNNGLWPAFWMLGTKEDWPQCGEIDILEMWGDGTKTHPSVESNLHWNDRYDLWPAYKDEYEDDAHGEQNITGVMNQYHLYTLIWDENSIKIYFDYGTGNQKQILSRTLNTSALQYAFKDKFFYFIINMAVGWDMGDWTGGRIITANEITALNRANNYETKMYIDYIRVYDNPSANGGLLWNDEFDGISINDNYWSVLNSTNQPDNGNPDSPSRGWNSNGEINFSRTANVTVENSNLVITTKREFGALASINVVTKPTKLTYNTGEVFNTAGMAVVAHHQTFPTHSVTINNYTIISPNMSQSGTQTVTVNYSFKSAITGTTVNAVATFNVTISSTGGSTAAKYLKVQGNKIVYGNDTVGFQEITLRGVNVWDFNHYTGSAQPSFNYIANTMKANAVRIPVHPKFWVNNKTTSLGRITRNVQAALNNNLFVIIDYHTIGYPDIMLQPHGENLYKHEFITARDFWQTIAAEPTLQDGRILYEIWNEPTIYEYDPEYPNDGGVSSNILTQYNKWSVLKSYWETLINDIRTAENQAAKPPHVIIAGGLEWTGVISDITSKNCLTDPNVGYAWHCYPWPWDPETASKKITYWKNRIGSIYMDKPIFVTEYGWESEDTKEENYAAIANFANIIVPNILDGTELNGVNLNSFAWCYNTSYGPRMIKGSSYPGTFNDFGNYVVNYLQGHYNAGNQIFAIP